LPLTGSPRHVILDVKVGAILTEIQQEGKRLRNKSFMQDFLGIFIKKPYNRKVYLKIAGDENESC